MIEKVVNILKNAVLTVVALPVALMLGIEPEEAKEIILSKIK